MTYLYVVLVAHVDMPLGANKYVSHIVLQPSSKLKKNTLTDSINQISYFHLMVKLINLNLLHPMFVCAMHFYPYYNIILLACVLSQSIMIFNVIKCLIRHPM